MTTLIAAAAFFLLLHLLVAGTPVRGAIVGVVGERPYLGLFSLASLGGIIWLAMAFDHARGEGATWWDLGPGANHASVAIQFVAFLFIVVGLLTPSPTLVMAEATLDKPDLIRGVLRITRNPFLWGVAIWAAGHLLANGDEPGVILFGSLLVLAVFGAYSIDAKRKKALGLKWDAYTAQTSNFPFAAIATGRQKFSLSEIGWWRIVLAVVIWAAVLWGHPYLFVVNPLA